MFSNIEHSNNPFDLDVEHALLLAQILCKLQVSGSAVKSVPRSVLLNRISLPDVGRLTLKLNVVTLSFDYVHCVHCVPYAQRDKAMSEILCGC